MLKRGRILVQWQYWESDTQIYGFVDTEPEFEYVYSAFWCLSDVDWNKYYQCGKRCNEWNERKKSKSLSFCLFEIPYQELYLICNFEDSLLTYVSR